MGNGCWGGGVGDARGSANLRKEDKRTSVFRRGIGWGAAKGR